MEEKFYIPLLKKRKSELNIPQIIRQQFILQRIHKLKRLYLGGMGFIPVDLAMMVNILFLHKMLELR